MSIRYVLLLTLLSGLLAASKGQAAQIAPGLRPLHLLNRLAFGPRPGDLEHVRRIGVEQYIQEQLHPESIPVPRDIQSQLEQLDTLRMDPLQLFVNYRPLRAGQKPGPEELKAARQRSRIIIEQAAQARLLLAMEDPRQLQQVMVDFWFNHFNVYAGKGLDRLWTGAFEEQVIRPYAMGRFRDLLEAAARHPAMLFYLDNWLNTGPGTPGARGRFQGLNENYARELMELHTLGVNGGYTQRDVIELARIFTGWGLINRANARSRRLLWWRGETRVGSGNGFHFDPDRHDFGVKLFLGHTIQGSGIGEGEEALDILARSPATARHIGYELAQYFVADDPPPSLIERLGASFMHHDGNIREVLNTLFHSPEFWDEKYYGNRFKTPYQFVISAVRAAGLTPDNFRPLTVALAQMGEPLYGCQTPDGYKFTQAAWLNPDAMMRRLSFAAALGAGRLPLMATMPAGESLAAQWKEMAPSDPYQLAQTVGNRFTHQTAKTVGQAPAPLRAALILGSPEFMMR